MGLKYRIRIEADYEDLNLNQNDEYMVEYNLLYKCSDKLWNDLLKKININNRDSMLEDILNSNNSFNEEELEFISKHDEELKYNKKYYLKYLNYINITYFKFYFLKIFIVILNVITKKYY